jgi:GTP-binding protein
VDAEFVHAGRRFVIVDTAGLKRRKSKMDRLEFYSSTRTRRAMAESDVVALVLDSRDGLLEGDKRIISEAIELKRGIVIVCNKMDLVNNPDYDNFLHHLKTEAPFLMHTPVLFVSAMERAGMEALLDRLSEVSARMRFMLPLEMLTNVIYDVRSMYSPGSRGRKVGEIRGVVQRARNEPRMTGPLSGASPPAASNAAANAMNIAGPPMRAVGFTFTLRGPGMSTAPHLNAKRTNVGVISSDTARAIAKVAR